MGHIIKGHLKRYWEATPTSDMAGVVDEVGDVDALNAVVFQALQLTNRMEHATAIRGQLQQGEHVVADRYWPSGWVYGQADGLDPEWVMRIQEHLPWPDLYLLIDIDPDMSAERRPERRDRYEEQEGLMERVTALYRQLWAEQQTQWDDGDTRWIVIDGRGSISEVAAQINEAVEIVRRAA